MLFTQFSMSCTAFFLDFGFPIWWRKEHRGTELCISLPPCCNLKKAKSQDASDWYYGQEKFLPEPRGQGWLFRWWRSRSQRPREGGGLRSELISTTLLKMSMRWSTPFPSVLSKNGGSKVECLLRSSQRMPWCKGRMMTVFKCRSLLSFAVLCAFMLWSADYLSLLVMLSCSLVLSSIGSLWPSMGLPFILLSYLVL